MKAVAAFLWVACLAVVLGLLFTISTDRSQLDQVAKDYEEVSAYRDKAVEDLAQLPGLRAKLHELRPGPLVVHPVRVKVAQGSPGPRRVTGSQKDVVAFVEDVLAQGYAAGELTIVPLGRKWQATLVVAETSPLP